MKTLFLILLSITINAQSNMLLLFSGGRVYSNNLITNAIDGTMEIGSTVYTSNFGTNADGWSTAVGGTTTGNIDGISDGTTSKDDVLRFYADGSSATHRTVKTVNTILTANRGYLIQFDYYIPAAMTHVDQGIWSDLTVDDISTVSNTYTTTGAWTLGKWNFLYLSGASLRWYQRDGTATSFTGANSDADDLTYWKDIVIKQIPTWKRNASHSSDTSTTYARTGSTSLKLVAAGAGSTSACISLAASQYTTLVEGTKYLLSFYVRSETATTTISYIIGDKTGTSANISTTGFDLVEFEFVATASTITQPLKLYLSKAATVYIDDLTLQSYVE